MEVIHATEVWNVPITCTRILSLLATPEHYGSLPYWRCFGVTQISYMHCPCLHRIKCFFDFFSGDFLFRPFFRFGDFCFLMHGTKKRSLVKSRAVWNWLGVFYSGYWDNTVPFPHSLTFSLHLTSFPTYPLHLPSSCTTSSRCTTVENSVDMEDEKTWTRPPNPSSWSDHFGATKYPKLAEMLGKSRIQMLARHHRHMHAQKWGELIW